MAEIVWTGLALEDLRQVHDYIARDSPQYAETMLTRIRSGMARLAIFPRKTILGLSSQFRNVPFLN